MRAHQCVRSLRPQVYRQAEKAGELAEEEGAGVVAKVTDHIQKGPAGAHKVGGFRMFVSVFLNLGCFSML